MYSRVSWLRPASGCNWVGSAKDEVPRKASTPWATDGSKGLGWLGWLGWKELLCGASCVVVATLGDEAEGCDDGDCDEDLRPMRASKMVIFRFGRWVRPWGSSEVEEMGRACSGQWAGWAVQRWGLEVVDVGVGRELAGSRRRTWSLHAIVKKIYSPDRATPVARAGSSVK